MSGERVYVAIADAFGIGYRVAEFLFSQYAYFNDKSRGAVARRMRYIADEIESLPARPESVGKRP